jgi:hypothetical protein
VSELSSITVEAISRGRHSELQGQAAPDPVPRRLRQRCRDYAGRTAADGARGVTRWEEQGPLQIWREMPPSAARPGRSRKGFPTTSAFFAVSFYGLTRDIASWRTFWGTPARRTTDLYHGERTSA